VSPQSGEWKNYGLHRRAVVTRGRLLPKVTRLTPKNSGNYQGLILVWKKTLTRNIGWSPKGQLGFLGNNKKGGLGGTKLSGGWCAIKGSRGGPLGLGSLGEHHKLGPRRGSAGFGVGKKKPLHIFRGPKITNQKTFLGNSPPRVWGLTPPLNCRGYSTLFPLWEVGSF